MFGFTLTNDLKALLVTLKLKHNTRYLNPDAWRCRKRRREGKRVRQKGNRLKCLALPGRTKRERGKGIPQSLLHHRSSVWHPRVMYGVTSSFDRANDAARWRRVPAIHHCLYMVEDMRLNGAFSARLYSICIDVALCFSVFSQILKAFFFSISTLLCFSLVGASTSPTRQSYYITLKPTDIISVY